MILNEFFNLPQVFEKDMAEAGYRHGFADPNAPGLGRKPGADVSGEGEPSGMFMVVVDGRDWKEFTSNRAFSIAKTIASKNPNKKVQVRWPNGALNTVKEGMTESAMDETHQELRDIVANEDFDALYELFTANTPTGRFVQDMYDDVVIDTGLHPDDDFERIEQIVFDRLADDFGDQDVEEGIFGSKPNPVLPIISKIDKVARELTPQNVETGKQIIQSQTRDITRMLSPQSKAGVDVIEQDELEEVDRRGFLKGVGAAAMAGAIPLGAKAQTTDYVQIANNAVRQAEQIVTGYASVMVGERRSYFANYIRENVYNQTIWYLNNTNGYNADQVINYSLGVAKRECDAIKTGVGDFIGGAGLRDNLGMKIVNTFVQTYSSALQQKYQQYRQEFAQQQASQQPTTLSKEDDKILVSAVHSYFFAKESGNEQVQSAVAQVLNKSIATFNNKETINRIYRNITTGVEKARQNDPAGVEKNKQIFIQDYQKFINDLEKVIARKGKPEDEFKESVQQGVAEGEVTKTATGLKHRATDKYGAGNDEPHHYTGGRSGFSDPGKYARDLEHVNKQLVKDLDASMGISWKNRGTKGVEVDEAEQQKGADYRDPPEANYDDKYQAMVKRVGQKARAQEKAKQQQPKPPVRENRIALLKQIIQS